MKYENIKKAKFLSRPNRFVAEIEIDGQKAMAHVKNTGRCKELLLPQADIYVREVDNPNRKTKYDLISVYKGETLVNIDSQIPNQVFHDWVLNTEFFSHIKLIKPEYTYKNSRFDFYLETQTDKILVEVKGVTLEENGVAMFPDAPTERGVKHLYQLMESLAEGYQAYIFFVIQMKGINYFTPNSKTHLAFAQALAQAQAGGVKVLAMDCEITSDSIKASNLVPVKIKG